MKALQRLFGMRRQPEAVCLDEIRAARIAEVRVLLAEIAERTTS
jgi:hypothetical protein